MNMKRISRDGNMNKVVAVISAVAFVGGLSAAANAQSQPVKGAAALSGIQSRSIRISSAPSQEPLLNPYEKITVGVSGLADNQVVYQQLNSDTNVILSPVKGDRELLNTANAGDTGNNRIQVLYQPAQ